MLIHSKTYTVESVTSGHPDKVCDQMSDALLDAYLTQDQQSRVAIECFGSHGLLVIGGEVTTMGAVDTEKTVREVYRKIGYDDRELRVIPHIAAQSPDIAQGVDTGGAGDQGIMYGYATNETKEMLPLGVVLSHALARRLEQLRRSGKLKWARPDGKTQVTISKGKVLTALCSTQHDAKLDKDELPLADAKSRVKELLTAELAGVK